MSEEIKQEIVEINIEDVAVSIKPTAVLTRVDKTTINQLDIYSDDIGENSQKTKKQKLEDTYLSFCVTAGFPSIEEWYVSKKRELLSKEKLTKEDDIMLKLLNTVATDLGYNDSNKEFIIGTGVKQLSSSKMLNR